jgi:hypothetical protein
VPPAAATQGPRPSAPPPPRPPSALPGSEAAGRELALGPLDPYALAAAAAAAAASSSGSPDGLPLPKYAHTYSTSNGRHALFGSPAAPGAGSGSAVRPAPSLPRYPQLDTGPARPSVPDVAALSLAGAARPLTGVVAAQGR